MRLKLTIFVLLVSPLIMSGVNIAPPSQPIHIMESRRIGWGYVTGNMDWSPQGTELAIGTTIGIQIYDTRNLNEPLRLLEGHSGYIRGVAFNSDGTMLASASEDGTVRLWDVASGSTLSVIEGYGKRMFNVAFGPNDTTLTFMGDEGVWLWDVAGNYVRNKIGHCSGYCPIFTSNLAGAMMAWVPSSSTISVWNATRETRADYFDFGSSAVDGVALSPDGTSLVGVGGEEIKVWDIVTGKIRQARNDVYWPESVTYSPDGTILAVTLVDGTIQLHDVISLEMLGRLEGHTDKTVIMFSPDGNQLVSTSLDRTVRLWDVPNQVALTVQETFNAPYIVSSPGELLLAEGTDAGVIRIWDPVTETDLITLNSGPYELNADGPGSHQFYRGAKGIVRCQDENTLLTIRWNLGHGGLWPVGTIYAWDIAHDPPAVIFQQGEARIIDIACTSDQKITLVWGTTQGLGKTTNSIINMTDIPNGMPTIIGGYAGHINGIALSPDGTIVAAVGNYQQTGLWNVSDNSMVFIEEPQTGMTSLAFSPDGRMLATGDATYYQVWLWDVNRARKLHILAGHTDDVNAVAFSADGTLLASAGYDKTVRLWDVASGTPLAVFEGHLNGIWQLAFSSDGTVLASASHDRTVRLWDISEFAQP